MEIPFRGQIDLGVLRRMNKTALAPSKKTLILGGITGLIILWGVVGVPLTKGGSLQSLLPILLVILLFGGLFGYNLYMAPRKLLQSSKLLDALQRGEVTEAGVRIETEHSRSELPWDVFLKARIGYDIVLLYQSIQLINVFPREFFTSDADWQAFVDLVRRRVPEKSPRERGGGSGLPRIFKTFMLWLAIFVVVILLWNTFSR